MRLWITFFSVPILVDPFTAYDSSPSCADITTVVTGAATTGEIYEQVMSTAILCKIGNTFTSL